MASADITTEHREHAYRQMPPHPALRRHIAAYYFYSGRSRRDGPAAAVPLTFPSDGGAELVINLGPSLQAGILDHSLTSFSGGMLIGPLSRSIRVAANRHTVFAAVRFQPGQSERFFDAPADELSDRVLALDLLWQAAGPRISDRIRNAGSFEAAAARFDRAFMQRLHDTPSAGDPRITSAVGAIQAGGGRCSVDRLVGPTGLGRRQFERRFRRQTGLSPKRLCRIVRFSSVLKRLTSHPTAGWADIAAACGYSDQAHLIRDCRYFTGRSPGAYLASQTPLEQAIFGTGEPMSHLFNTPSLSLR